MNQPRKTCHRSVNSVLAVCAAYMGKTGAFAGQEYIWQARARGKWLREFTCRIHPAAKSSSSNDGDSAPRHTSSNPRALALPPGRGVGSPGRCASRDVCAVDDKEIDTAKMQVQGQLAAQYIQDVMQARPKPTFTAARA